MPGKSRTEQSPAPGIKLNDPEMTTEIFSPVRCFRIAFPVKNVSLTLDYFQKISSLQISTVDIHVQFYLVTFKERFKKSVTTNEIPN